jgi:ribosome biogenesis GTPase
MPDDGKYKGQDWNPREGLGRLRRAAEKTEGRTTGWERHAEDDGFLERHAQVQRGTHLGESLLASFNRLARDAGAAPEGTAPGTVSGFLGKTVVVRLDEGGELTCEVRQALKKGITGVKNPLCVGDRVHVERPGAGEGVIAGIVPRRSQLARADSHNKALLHVLAANVDRLVVVSAMADPEFKPGFLDRYLVIAAANGIEPVIVLNKRDLADPSRALELYRGIGYTTVATSVHDPADPGLTELRQALAGATAVFAGQSGVGKSSLLNALFPHVAARVGDVSANTGLGRHTTTAARSYPLPGGGTLIDTPGIRECAIAGVTPLDVALFYPEIARLHHACRFNDCSHRHEPDCAVGAAVERGEIAASRYDSYCSIVEEDLGER